MNPLRKSPAELRAIADELYRLAYQLDGGMGRTAGLAHPAAGLNQSDEPPSMRAIAQAAYRARRERARFLPESLFFEPAWDMLLELYVATCDRKMVATGSLCVASGVPEATALRYLEQLVSLGLAQRFNDSQDRRRVLVQITEAGRIAMAGYFRSLAGGRFGPTPEQVLIDSPEQDTSADD